MSKYDRSTHRNDKAAKNRITDNRQEQEDSQWAFDHPEANFTGYILLILAGIIGCFFVTAYIRMHRPVVVSMTPCVTCHYTEVPVIKNLSQYKAALKRRAALKVRPVDLAELVRP
jgi:hypothetical protein